MLGTLLHVSTVLALSNGASVTACAGQNTGIARSTGVQGQTTYFEMYYLGPAP